MPNITSLEMAVVGTAVLLLFVAPAVLSWIDHRRWIRSHAAPPTIVTAEGAPAGAAVFQQSPVAAVEQVTAEPAAEVEETAMPEPPPDASGAAVPQSPALEPVGRPDEPRDEETRCYNFRLQDLRRVRLRDWPPLHIRTDPERHRVWLEAERLAEDHESAINATSLSSSHPPQSVCLGAAEAEGTTLRLRFLLFPILWPSQEDQAFAEAIFEVDGSGGAVRSWIQMRQKS